jgi:hypothetical protein
MSAMDKTKTFGTIIVLCLLCVASGAQAGGGLGEYGYERPTMRVVEFEQVIGETYIAKLDADTYVVDHPENPIMHDKVLGFSQVLPRITDLCPQPEAGRRFCFATPVMGYEVIGPRQGNMVPAKLFAEHLYLEGVIFPISFDAGWQLEGMEIVDAGHGIVGIDVSSLPESATLQSSTPPGVGLYSPDEEDYTRPALRITLFGAVDEFGMLQDAFHCFPETADAVQLRFDCNEYSGNSCIRGYVIAGERESGQPDCALHAAELGSFIGGVVEDQGCAWCNPSTTPDGSLHIIDSPFEVTRIEVQFEAGMQFESTGAVKVR